MRTSTFARAVAAVAAFSQITSVAATKLTPNVVIPLYIYPSASAWNTYFSAISARPDITFSVIVNPNNGPGAGSAPDSNYIANIATLNSFHNVRTLGYVHVSEATRSISAVQADIATFGKWASYTSKNIQMDGIFFDEAPSAYTKATANYMSTVASKTRSALKNSKVAAPYVMFNPGTTPASAFYGIADSIVVFENAWSQYTSTSLNAIPAAYRTKSTFIIHNFSGSTTAQSNFVTALRQAGYTGSFVTNQASYQTIPSSWAPYTQSVSKAYSS